MSVLLFYAGIILLGGLVAAAMVGLPRVALQWALAAYLPGWLIILFAYALSIGAVKLLNRGFPGFIFLSTFILMATTVDHLFRTWQALGPAGRIVLIVVVSGALLLAAADLRSSGKLWPLTVLQRIAAFLR